jgi:hypothetical protein
MTIALFGVWPFYPWHLKARRIYRICFSSLVMNALPNVTDISFDSDSKLTRTWKFPFQGTSLKTLVLPGSLTTLFGSVFVDVPGESILFASLPRHFCFDSIFLAHKTKRDLSRHFGHASRADDKSSIRVIRDNCFACCSFLSFVTFSEGLQLFQIFDQSFFRSG